MRKHAGKLIVGLSGLVLAAGLVAFGQEGNWPGPPDAAGILGFEAGPGGHGHVVKGAPVSAQKTTETVGVLSDGTHIDRKSTQTFYRDSEGRTRAETTVGPIGAPAEQGAAKHLVFINDPVAHAHYLLEPDQKIARQDMGRGPHGGWAHAGPMEHPIGGDSANVTKESLGTQTINGVSATGTRITRTIPAGRIGNDKAIQIVTEHWYSSDLKMDVMTKHVDPLFGTTTTQLTNISREEPAATLFQVPADYTMKSGQGHKFARPAAPPAPAEPPSE